MQRAVWRRMEASKDEHQRAVQGRLGKLPLVPKPVMKPSVTVTGMGSSGLGDQCHSAARDRSVTAYEEWVAEKMKSRHCATQHSNNGGRSPRERYYLEQQEHREALERFEEQRRNTIKALRRERKLERQQHAKEQSELAASRSKDVQDERSERRQRLDAQAQLATQHAFEERLLANSISSIWLQAGHEEEMQRKQEIAARRRQLDDERHNFLEAQVAARKQREEFGARTREERRTLESQVHTQRDELEKIRKADVAAQRKAIQQASVLAKFAWQEEQQKRAKLAKKEEAQLEALRKGNRARQAHEIHFQVRSGSQSHQRSINAMEESLLQRQRHADEVREWKVRRAASALD